MMNKISFKTIWLWLPVLALLCVAPILLIYYIWTQDSSVDPLIAKFQLQICINKSALDFEKCAEKVGAFARESLEIREARINRWLYGIAGFLALVTWFFTALAILIATGGILGISIFNSLKKQAEDEVRKINRIKTKAKKRFEKIKSIFEEMKDARDDVNEINEHLYQKLEDSRNHADDLENTIAKSIEHLDGITNIYDEIDALYDRASQSAEKASGFENIIKEHLGRIEHIEVEAQEILSSLKKNSEKDDR